MVSTPFRTPEGIQTFGPFVYNDEIADCVMDLGHGTDALKLPGGTTAQRPGTPAVGMTRYNSSFGYNEIYDTEWRRVGVPFTARVNHGW